MRMQENTRILLLLLCMMTVDKGKVEKGEKGRRVFREGWIAGVLLTPALFE